MLNEKLYGGPRNGNKDDKAHPPIHPVKVASAYEFSEFKEKDKYKSEDHWRIYDLVVRHFLASLSRDAVGNQTHIEVTLADEVFSANGLKIESKNYLEIYDKWETNELPDF